MNGKKQVKTWSDARESSRRFRRALRVALAERDMTMADLARAAKVGRSAVTMWAFGINKHSARIEEALIRLGIRIELSRGCSLRRAA